MRHKNAVWNLDEHPVWDGIKVGLLMDLRDELQGIRKVLENRLNCVDTVSIPRLLRDIRRNTARRRRKK